jgi:hypothetical protein
MKSLSSHRLSWLHLGLGAALVGSLAATQAFSRESAQPIAMPISQSSSPPISQPVSQQRSCTETEAAQAPWIRWAMHARNICAVESADHAEFIACLRTAKKALASLEREHENIYRAEVRTLPPEHPVVQAILTNLKNKADAAARVIEQDDSPPQMSALTPPASCQNQN